MAIKAVLFDLDGTLLPMDQDEFVKYYFGLLAKRMAPRGYDPKELVSAIWAGTGAMVKNDGTKSNEAVFWENFAAVFGEKSLEDKPFVDEFYSNEFHAAKVACGYSPMAKEAVELVKSRGVAAVLATNPIFPAVATRNRIGWAGLEVEDFLFFTAYENSCHSKPNPEYYKDILKKLELAPEACIMVGNDVSEDMIAESLGMQVFLLTDCLINKENADIDRYPHGDFPELISYLSQKLV